MKNKRFEYRDSCAYQGDEVGKQGIVKDPYEVPRGPYKQAPDKTKKPKPKKRTKK